MEMAVHVIIGSPFFLQEQGVHMGYETTPQRR